MVTFNFPVPDENLLLLFEVTGLIKQLLILDDFAADYWLYQTLMISLLVHSISYPRY